MPIYGVDVASYQGKPGWQKVYGAGIRFAFSKVTESTGYTNPTWAHNRAGMLALGDSFLPGAYHFLHGGNGAAQARYFLSKAGDVSRFAVALDVEASGADTATSRAWVAEFKRLAGGHPVIGYYPRWYWEQTGQPDLSFFDSVWQSHYVSGSGSLADLYVKVPSSWWTSFGGEPISILQFSSSATVSGITGHADANAYKGSLDQLRALALGQEDDVSAEDVWNHPIDTGDGGKPWRAGAVLGHLEKEQDAIKAKLDALLAASGQKDVDEAAIVSGVLTGLTPSAIAAAVMQALPADLAAQVVGELKARLEA